MKPIVNIEESFGKVVGRTEWGPKDYDRMVDNAMALMPRLPFPKGVFKFRSFEEANEWTEKHIMEGAIKRSRARQKGKI